MPTFSLEHTENGQKQSFPFDSASVSIGRDKASDFVLDHPTVSRQHALIVHNQRGYQLVVLSRGGMTAVDGDQVFGDVDLHDGNVLHFGQLHFTFRSADAPAKASNGSSQQQSKSAGMGASGGFSQPGGFGGQQQQGGGFGGQQQGGGFGGQQQQQGGNFGQQQSPPFGQQQQPGNFGAQQQGGGFGGQQPGGGFGGQQQGGGFGGQQQQQGGGFGQQQQGGGFGAPGGGFGPPGGQGPSPEASAEPKDPNGIVSWDEIANSAEARGEVGVDDRTDFEKIKAAQAKAVKQSQGTNPVIVVGAGVLIVGLLGYTFYDSGGTATPTVVKEVQEKPYITWEDADLECVGEAECMQRAERAFAVGVDNLEKQDVELSFLFEGYKNLEMADKFVEKAGKERPAVFSKADAAKKEARADLDILFKKFQAEYHNAEKRKMYRNMAQVIARVKTYFPYKGAREHQWAVEKEHNMKDRGIYPRNPFGRR